MGKPSPGIELAILDSNGDSVVDREGDLAVLITPTSEHLIFNGYRKVTNGQIQIVRPEIRDPRGRRWYRTGDRGYVDKDGYYWFVGRDDDVCPSESMRLTTGNKVLWVSNWSI
jgi:acyl-coenzyme A synthetase/AMP-(fatty) acid ligase